MTTRTRPTAALVAAAALAALALPCTPATAAAPAGTLSPLPASDYSVRAVCTAPRPGHAGCLALRLVAETPAARAHTHPLAITRSVTPKRAGGAAETCEPPTAAEGCYGLTPQNLHSGYQLPSGAPSAQTVALVDAYNDPTAEADLNTYDEEFGLPECTTANGCFEQVNELGEVGRPPFPRSTGELEGAREGGEAQQEEAEEAEGWSVEMSLDIETAHATCQSCKILLVEADSTSEQDLGTAERTAATLGADEISNSWGGPECIEVGGPRECVPDDAAFNHPGIVITASAGDDGYLSWDSPEPGFAEYPASSPHVVAVGGTRLLLTDAGAWASESAWNDGGESKGKLDGYGAGGGGCSVQFTAQPWQQSVSDWPLVGCGARRAVADVAADADPYTGLAVYDSSSEECEAETGEGVVHWCTIGGTSLSSPLIASVFALAGGAHGVQYPARTLYENELDSPGSLHDVTVGSNGECRRPFDELSGQSGCSASEEAHASCSAKLICMTSPGYDGPTGVGTPDGISAFIPPAEEPAARNENGKGEGSGTGSSPNAPAILTPSVAAPAPSAGAPSVQLSELALTLKALVALDASRPKIAQLGFAFRINVATRVRASLERRVARRGHARWRAITNALTFVAVSGRNTRRLGGHGVLSAGTYRLTLTPAHGTARSVVFKIG